MFAPLFEYNNKSRSDTPNQTRVSDSDKPDEPQEQQQILVSAAPHSVTSNFNSVFKCTSRPFLGRNLFTENEVAEQKNSGEDLYSQGKRRKMMKATIGVEEEGKEMTEFQGYTDTDSSEMEVDSLQLANEETIFWNLGTDVLKDLFDEVSVVDRQSFRLTNKMNRASMDRVYPKDFALEKSSLIDRKFQRKLQEQVAFLKSPKLPFNFSLVDIDSRDLLIVEPHLPSAMPRITMRDPICLLSDKDALILLENLPQELEELDFQVDLTRELSCRLPRSLKTLAVRHIFEGAAEHLPQELEELKLETIHADGLSHLPSSLSILEVRNMSPDDHPDHCLTTELGHISEQLNHLKISLPDGFNVDCIKHVPSFLPRVSISFYYMNPDQVPLLKVLGAHKQLDLLFHHSTLTPQLFSYIPKSSSVRDLV